MSVINNALSKLAEQQTDTVAEPIVRANVKQTKSHKIGWIALGFILSLGIGAWAITGNEDNNSAQAINDQFANIQAINAQAANSQATNAQSNNAQSTNNQIANTQATITQNSMDHSNGSSEPVNSNSLVDNNSAGEGLVLANNLSANTLPANTSATNTSATNTLAKNSVSTHNSTAGMDDLGGRNSATSVTAKVLDSSVIPVYSNNPSSQKNADFAVAANSPANRNNSANKNNSENRQNNSSAQASSNNRSSAKKTADNGPSSLSIKQVSLSNYQLAEKAIDRAQKALEANNLLEATTAYDTALRYTPKDEDTRRRLAALYYGNRDTRKSAEILEAGIRLNSDSTNLRLALADILIKENQSEAALSVLNPLPNNASIKYLAMRAAMAQQMNNNAMAYQSYQILTQRDQTNARWWMGLGIQQERDLKTAQAKASYQKSLNLVGLSSQSQAFIRERISLLDKFLEGGNTNVSN